MNYMEIKSRMINSIIVIDAIQLREINQIKNESMK